MPITKLHNVSYYLKFSVSQIISNSSLESARIGQGATRSNLSRPGELSIQEAYNIINVNSSDPIEKINKVEFKFISYLFWRI
jgi:hypothetical protein